VGIACKIIFVLGKSTQRLRALVAEEEARYSSTVERPIEEDTPQRSENPQETTTPHAT
jgi:hypothetical protein